MSLAALANHMASKGRHGDSVLVHMSPEEVRALQALAERHGKTLTINPETGQPEAFSLKSLLPMIAGAALNFFAPGVGTAIGSALGTSAAVGTGIAVGGITSLATGSLSRGLMAGLGAYGGAGLAEGLAGAGTGALAASDIAAQQAAGTFPTLAEGATQAQVADYTAQVSALRDEALKKAGEAGLGEKLSSGLGQVASNPGAYAKDALKYGYTAAMPVMADAMVPTTTSMPGAAQGPSYIRQKRYDPYAQQYIDLEPVEASKWGSRSFSNYADGGIVALANGGTFNEDLYLRNKLEQLQASPTVLPQDYAGTFSDVNYLRDYMAKQGMTPEQHYARFGVQEGVTPYTATDVVPDFSQSEYLKNKLEQMKVTPSAVGEDYKGTLDDPNYLRAYMAQKGMTPEQHYARFGFTEGVSPYEKAQAIAPTTPTTPVTAPVTAPVTTPGTYAPPGTQNPYGNVTNPGDLTRNVDGTTTVTPNVPGRPYGGFTGIEQLRSAYTAGGGSLGQENLFVPQTVEDMYARYGNTGGSQQAYDYLMGKGAVDIKKPVTGGRPIMLPYTQSVMGRQMPAPTGPATQKLVYDWTKMQYVPNPAYEAAQQAAAEKAAAEKAAEDASAYNPSSFIGGGLAAGGMALGGLGALAGGGQAGYNLGGYSDGGRLLRGPGDGVSDSIPATIGDKQPARLADGEFVVPARIVSELGNGSTEAGARKLYAMMDRVQRARGKTTGKGKVASNTRADKYLPA